MVIIDLKLLTTLTQEAALSSRKRKNHNFHKHPSDTLQRMLNAFEPDTYVRPHKHEDPDKREVLILLTGKAAVVEFDAQGKMVGKTILDQKNGNFGVEIPPRVYHTIISLEKGTVLYELKDGPYKVANDKGFASWAPEEGSVEAPGYLQQLIREVINM
jgi:cupin fold WbuC family metalloprotein